jgi:hypothetical protein
MNWESVFITVLVLMMIVPGVYGSFDMVKVAIATKDQHLPARALLFSWGAFGLMACAVLCHWLFLYYTHS